MTQHVVIIGSGGQDGQLLSAHLKARGAVLTEIEKAKTRSPHLEKSEMVDVRIPNSLDGLLQKSPPHQLYYLAAHHHSAERRPESDGDLMSRSFETHVHGFTHVLESLRKHAPACRVFYASSSLVFAPDPTLLNEKSPMEPSTAYGISKAAGMQIGRLYRREHGLFVSSGILFNHESTLRPPHFVTSKVIDAAVRAERDPSVKLHLGNLGAVVDWGYAPDYVEAMRHVLEVPEPDDFVIATGIPHTVQELVALAFGQVGLQWQNHVEGGGDPGSSELGRIGDARKLRMATQWKPSMDFSEMVALLVQARRLRVA